MGNLFSKLFGKKNKSEEVVQKNVSEAPETMEQETEGLKLETEIDNSEEEISEEIKEELGEDIDLNENKGEKEMFEEKISEENHTSEEEKHEQ